MISQVEGPKGKNEEFFLEWKKSLEKLLKAKSYPSDKTHLLQCPFSFRLKQLKKEVKHEPFIFWGKESVVDFGSNRFLKMQRITKSHHPNLEKALPIVRSYRDGHNNKRGEENALTFLYEKSGDSTICPPEGAVVDFRGTISKYPSVLSEEARDFLRFKVVHNLQQVLTPMGKKGLIAFHTQNQYCSLESINRSTFQRFFIGPTPQDALVRMAHTLCKLANADPKTIKKGLSSLQSLYFQNLRELGQKVLRDIEVCMETSYVENLYRNAQQFAIYGLPYINIGEGRVFFELCSDLNEGYRYQTCALSLRIETDNEYFDSTTADCWKTLTK